MFYGPEGHQEGIQEPLAPHGQDLLTPTGGLPFVFIIKVWRQQGVEAVGAAQVQTTPASSTHLPVCYLVFTLGVGAVGAAELANAPEILCERAVILLCV